MGLLQWLFKRKKATPAEENWEEIVYSREGVDFQSGEDRNSYIEDCLEQMSEAKKEIELLNGEYSIVTAYLTDTEEIEALPESEKDALNITANRLKAIEQERQKYLSKKDKMPDSVYYRMKERENELEGAVRKMRDAESFSTVVKQDLQRLSREKHAYAYRKEELYGMLANFKGMAIIFFVAMLVCVFILALLQFSLELDAGVGYFVAIIVTAVAMTVLYIKYTDARREVQRVERARNRLIQLQNKVKIKYVNNTNLLNYLYLKYQVKNAAALEKSYAQYLEEREGRNQYAEAEAKKEYYMKQLTEQLGHYRVRYPQRFTARVDALLDRKELVEMRHELILRRQALRKQIEYNDNVIKQAREEIMEVARLYPEYAEEIAEKVNKYEKKPY